MAPTPVCKYYLKGECRYGDRCKFDHPRNIPRNENRFAAFQSPETSSRDSYGRGTGDGRSTTSQAPAFSLNRDIIVADLSTERPQWILSAYGPGSKAPAQLFGGSLREQSFEEMRFHHYNGVASGNPDLAMKQANALVQEAEKQMRIALGNVDAAMDFIYRAEKEHPNRNDICQASTTAPSSTGISFGNPVRVNNLTPPQQATNFGQPSVLGTKLNPFVASQQTFGQPSIPGSTGTFGQPSALGLKTNPFGSQPGGATLAQGTSNTTGPFSSLTVKSNPFGTPAQSQPTLPFAQSGTLLNPFGQASSHSQPSPFASLATPAPFSVPSPEAQRNPFGTASQFAQGNPSTLGLAQTPQSNPFGQSKQASPSPNSFVQPASATANPFDRRLSSSGDPHSTQLSTSNQVTQGKANGTSSQGPYGPNSQLQHPTLQAYVSKDGDQRLRMFKGKPVIYKESEPGVQNRDGTWEKIWFPEGPPVHYGATELGEDAYTEDIKQAYFHLRETGSFKDGIMPPLPPKREWCLWDF